jgi:biopolymer transport protein ExbB
MTLRSIFGTHRIWRLVAVVLCISGTVSFSVMPATAQDVGAPAAQDGGATAPALPAPVMTAPAPAETPAPATAVTESTPAAADNAASSPASPSTEATSAPSALSETEPNAEDASPKKADLPHDLSPLKMFLAADSVVKGVMIFLILASVTTWTVWLAKSLELAAAKRRLVSAFSRINATASLAEAAQRLGDSKRSRSKRCIVSSFINLAITELRLSADIADKNGIKERVQSRLDGLSAAAGRHINRGTGVLATIGSTAPFIGLFGTVWGIMNSFIGISETQTTNLAIVAPGIAEALLATATGLIAAIPAVITYNHFSRQISRYKALIGEASAEVMRLVSRDLDRGMKPILAQQAAE